MLFTYCSFFLTMIKLHLETEKQTANGLKKKQIEYFNLLSITVL